MTKQQRIGDGNVNAVAAQQTQGAKTLRNIGVSPMCNGDDRSLATSQAGTYASV